MGRKIVVLDRHDGKDEHIYLVLTTRKERKKQASSNAKREEDARNLVAPNGSWIR
jgi:hypothetical protein